MVRVASDNTQSHTHTTLSLSLSLSLCLWDFSGGGIGPPHRPLPDKSQHSQQTDIHAHGGIRSRNPIKPAAAEPGLKPRSHPIYFLSCLFNLPQFCGRFNISLSRSQYRWRCFLTNFCLKKRRAFSVFCLNETMDEIQSEFRSTT